MAHLQSSSLTVDVMMAETGFQGVDGTFRACSWPAATPSRLKPEPPKAPSRKPSIADWEVPPLALPVANTKRRHLTVSTFSFTSSVGLSTGSFTGSTGEGGKTGSACSSFAGRGLPEDHALQEEDFDMDSDNDLYDVDVDEEAYEAVIFALDGDHADDNDDDESDSIAFQMGGAESGQSSKVSSFIGKARCIRSVGGSSTPPLGASPMLLSALEEVAKAEASAFADLAPSQPCLV
mmetsp:Transcript_130159/g.376566  ORF Transcript_130159/g.376566 Transcript_130159/m.376566 type:complete len:235 (-) Transcript_130159:179-883(-)